MQRQLGVTITDAIFSVLILSIGILGTIKFSTVARTANITSMQRSEAMTFAEDKIDSFRRYSSLTSGTGITAYADITSNNDTVTGESATYTRTWAVTDHTTYKTVSLTVTWTAADNSSQSLNLVTSISKIDPTTSGNLLVPYSTPLSP